MEIQLSPVDKLFMSYLTYANSHTSLVKNMIAAGANVNCRDNNLNTPLHLVLQYCADKLRMVQLLIKAGSNPNSYNVHRNTPLHIAIIYCEDIEVIHELLKYGASVHLKDILDNSPLHLAVTNCKESIVKLIIQSKADINLRNWNGETPLICAVKADCLAIVKELLLSGAVVSVSTDDGSSPLHVALKKSPPNLDIIIELLKCNADIYSLDTKLGFPLLFAVKRYYKNPSDNLQLAKTLLKFDALQKCYRHKGFRYFDELKNFTVFSDLVIFYQECISEVSRMKSEYIQSNLSILECSVKALKNQKIVQGRLLQKELTMSEVLRISLNYPIYRAMIASCLRKTDLQNLLLGLYIYTNKECGLGRLQCVILNGDLTFLISIYLSNVDILNLIIAFSTVRDF
ncbi:Ankyrin-1 [Araneus ventricosus]|uniref:Ankyrin-1 n=1 Tax=Araneus ventricosus TaxID=182803 RepID=A0A4Y2DIT9_ARAVE|nr:Ankyrin-1 [Araneus ventricosus]